MAFMRYRPQRPATLLRAVSAAVRDALLFPLGAAGSNIGSTGAVATAASPVLSAEGVAVNSFNRAWSYPGYSALPITVIIDFRTVGAPIVSRHALWSSRSGSDGNNGLYLRYNPTGVLELLRSQQAQFGTASYTLPSRGGVVAFTYDGTNYKIAADGVVLASGASVQTCSFNNPSVGVEGGAQSIGGDVSNAVFRGVIVLPRVVSNDELVSFTRNPYQLLEAPEQGADAPAASGGTISASVTEAATAADNSAAVAVFAVSNVEAIAAADTCGATVITAAAIAETAAAADTTSLYAIFTAQASESGSAADSQAASATFIATRADSLSAAEACSTSGGVMSASMSEAGSASEAAGAVMVAVVTRTDAASATETLSAQRVTAAAIAESATASDVTSAFAVTMAALAESCSIFDQANWLGGGMPFVPPSRTVVFGGGTNTVAFDGGSKLVAFGGGNNQVSF